jgi:hypothetical protein
MLTREFIAEISKDDIPVRAETLLPEDIRLLVDLLQEKDDNLRYHAFLLLQNRSQKFADVYPFWDELAAKFSSENSYQCSLGLMLIAENTRWDSGGKFDPLLDQFLAFVDDEKPITVRQCVQSLKTIIPNKPHLISPIRDRLLGIDIPARKETQQKILLMDILSVFAVMRRFQKDEKVERYIVTALTGERLDKKAKAEIQNLLNA